MDEFEYINEHFSSTLELIHHSLDQLTAPLVAACGSCSEAILNDRKIMAIGNGSGGIAAQLLVTLLTHKLHHERPGLPAMTVGLDPFTQSYMSSEGSVHDIFSKPLQSLAHEDDILVIFSPEGSAKNLMHAIQAAHGRSAQIVLFSAGDNTEIVNMLDQDDITIHLDTPDPSQALEVQIMAIHAFCQLIEWYIFSIEDDQE